MHTSSKLDAIVGENLEKISTVGVIDLGAHVFLHISIYKSDKQNKHKEGIFLEPDGPISFPHYSMSPDGNCVIDLDMCNPDFQGACYSSIQNASSSITTKLQIFHDKIGYELGKINKKKFQKLTNQILFRILDVASFGILKKALLEEFDLNYKTFFGWFVLYECAQKYSNALSQDAEYLNRGDSELSEKLSRLSSFYENVSTEAFHAQNRARHLVEEYIQLYSYLDMSPQNDVEIIREKFTKKIIDYFYEYPRAAIEKSSEAYKKFICEGVILEWEIDSWFQRHFNLLERELKRANIK